MIDLFELSIVTFGNYLGLACETFHRKRKASVSTRKQHFFKIPRDCSQGG